MSPQNWILFFPYPAWTQFESKSLCTNFRPGKKHSEFLKTKIQLQKITSRNLIFGFNLHRHQSVVTCLQCYRMRVTNGILMVFLLMFLFLFFRVKTCTNQYSFDRFCLNAITEKCGNMLFELVFPFRLHSILWEIENICNARLCACVCVCVNIDIRIMDRVPSILCYFIMD